MTEFNHYMLLYPSRYLRAVDLQGADVTFTIARKPEREELTGQGGKKERKAVIYFEETAARAKRDGEEEKRWVCNVTNANTIAAMYGPDPRQWAGKRITLFPTTTSVGGKVTDCIRVRPAVPAPTTK